MSSRHNRILSVLFCLACGMGISTITSGGPPFDIHSVTTIPVGERPSGVAVGDLNNNGLLDIATVVDSPDRVAILLNDGAGGFMPGPAIFLPSSSSPQDVIAGDFNSDGLDDIAVAVRDPAGSVLVYQNNGNGTFTLSGTFPVQDRPRGLSVGDIESNGFLDMAVANRDSDSASVLLNDSGGSGNFAVTNIAVGGETRATVLADITADGVMELAVTNRDDRAVHVYSKAGSQWNLLAIGSVGPQVRPEGITAGDFDLDGIMDIAAATSGQNNTINQASIFAGPTVTGPINVPTGGVDTSHIVAVDLDCDGFIDLATSNSESDNVSLLHNLGNFTFAAPMTVLVGTRPGRLATADLTNDGSPDLAVANRDSDDLTVINNVSCPEQPSCPGDLNGDNVVNVLDLLLLLEQWGSCPDCSGDLNGDGVINVLDLLILLENWGNCP